MYTDTLDEVQQVDFKSKRGPNDESSISGPSKQVGFALGAIGMLVVGGVFAPVEDSDLTAMDASVLSVCIPGAGKRVVLVTSPVRIVEDVD